MSVDNKKNLSEALRMHQTGDWKSAHLTYKKILSNDFYHPQANYLLGILLSQEKGYADSTTYLERALPYLSENADLANALSINYQKEGLPKTALYYINWAININPNYPHFHHRKAKILVDQTKVVEAINHANNAIKLDKNFIPAYLTISHCYQLIQKPHRAIKFINSALPVVTENRQKLLFNLANLYIEILAFNKAQEIVDLIKKEGNSLSEGHALQAMINGELNQSHDAIVNLETSLEINNNIIANWNLALLHLKNKSFDKGWKLYDCGFSVNQRRIKTIKNTPVWRGEAIHLKDILIVNEQGIGDEIMFSQFYNDVSSNSALCTILCDPRLVDILAHSYPEAEVQSRYTPLNKNQAYDYTINAGSIAQHLDTHKKIKHVSLQIPPRYTAPTKIKIDHKLLNIGFSWKGGVEYKGRIRRSTHIRDWKKIFHTPGCHFWCLQHSMVEQDRRFLNKYSNNNISYLDNDELNNDLNFLGTVINKMDLIISVDNSLTHLAGSLGKKTFCILPFNADWRWSFDDEKSYWYKDVILFRKKSLENWTSTFDELAHKLEKL